MAKEDALEFIIEARLKKDKFIKECKQVANLSGKFGKIIEENLTAGKDLPKYMHKSEDGKSAFALAKVGKNIHKLSYKISKDNKATLKGQGRVSKKDLARYFKYDLPQMELQASALEGKWQRDKEAQKLAKEEERANRQAKKPMSWTQKFWNSFKRIGFYRLIRGFFASLKNTFVQGTQTLALFDKEANKSLSSIVTSVDKLKASVVVAFMPIVDMVAPIFEDIANTVVNVANEISKASSASKGLSEYTAVSDEYMKDYANTVNKVLTSFDKFETVNGSSSNPLTKKNMSEEEMAKAQASTANNVLNSIKGVASSVWDIIKTVAKVVGEVWKEIEPYIDDITLAIEKLVEVIGKIVSRLAEWIGKAIDWLNENGLMEEALYSILAVILLIEAVKLAKWFSGVAKSAKEFSGALGGILLFVGVFTIIYDALNSLKGTEKIIAGLITAVVGLAVALVALQEGSKFGVVGAIAGSAIALAGIVASIKGASEIELFAKGGIAEKGNLFIANERGPELVYSGPNNSSSIMNIQQFKQAMVEALYEASDVFQSQEGEVVLNLDGAEIARSKRFTNEINRKNAGINLR